LPCANSRAPGAATAAFTFAAAPEPVPKVTFGGVYS
jgi:hypothetical protein